MRQKRREAVRQHNVSLQIDQEARMLKKERRRAAKQASSVFLATQHKNRGSLAVPVRRQVDSSKISMLVDLAARMIQAIKSGELSEVAELASKIYGESA